MTDIQRYKWFWPWQDQKEEAWLESMSKAGLHLESVHLPCAYRFNQGKPQQYTYRLDYILVNRDQKPEYLQIFQDAGWEHLGEMSNWQYWRKQFVKGETAEIFTDRESKLKKYQRMLGVMLFFLFFLAFLGFNGITNWSLFEDIPAWISAIYAGGMICYAVIIPIYIVVVVQLLRRINQLKKKSI
jgi:hypothetical protein